MSKKEVSKTYLEKYFAVLNKFGVTPNFKFDDNEKDIIKYLDEVTSVSFLSFCDRYDLRPSEAKEIIDALVKKGALKVEEDNISLTSEVIKYIHTSKEQRKSEKKFRKFIDALTEKDLDEFMKLVESFVIKEEPIRNTNNELKKTTTRIRKTPVKKVDVVEEKKEVVSEVKPTRSRRTTTNKETAPKEENKPIRKRVYVKKSTTKKEVKTNK